MVLVDEKLLDYQPMLQTKPDLSWKRPTEQSVKSSISQQMKSTLDDPTLPEDVKAKHYTQSLSRFLHTKHKLVDETPAVVTQPAEAPPVKKKKPHVSVRLKSKRKLKRRESPEPERKRKPKHRESPEPEPEVKPTRISLRLQRHPKPFKWDEWK